MECGKCSKTIQTADKQMLVCNICKLNYHLLCTTVSESRFYNTLTGHHRENWKCESCVASTSNYTTPINSISINNVTRRRLVEEVINIPTDNSFQSLSVESDIDELGDSLPGDGSVLNRSCPELQTLRYKAEIECMKEKIDDLENKLQIAENEIENQLSENCALKNRILEKDFKIGQLQNFIKSTPTNTPKSKERRSTINKSETKPTEKTQVASLLTETKESINNIKRDQADVSDVPEINSIKQDERNARSETKRTKLTILSSNKKNAVLQAAEKKIPQAQICHFLTSNGGIQQILDGIETKLHDFTHKDFCIVFIGQNDFQTTKSYKLTIDYIREKILLVQHTNVIICLPTYNCCGPANLNLYNNRIEIFNKLLYRDNLAHNYAYLIDSNKNLDYSPKMFNTKTGCINGRAFRSMLDDILKQMTDITTYYNSEEENRIEHPSQNKIQMINETSDGDFFRK